MAIPSIDRTLTDASLWNAEWARRSISVQDFALADRKRNTGRDACLLLDAVRDERRQIQPATHRNLTLQLVWEEYREDHQQGYSYSRYVAAVLML